MSYDRIWIESTDHPRGLLERREAARRNQSDDFYTNYDRLNARGNKVALKAGKNQEENQ